MAKNVTPATAAEAGIVRIHAHTMRPATPQRTAERRFVEPTPTIAPVMVWVVLTGIPFSARKNKVVAPAASAQNPPTGFSLVIFEPMVWTMRQPPKYVPRPMAACAERMMDHRVQTLPQPEANSAGVKYPPASSAPAIMPMVFWASLPP